MNAKVHSLVWIPNSDSLVLGLYAAETNIQVWSVNKGVIRYADKGHRIGVCCVMPSHDGHLLASSGDDDGIVRLWDVSTDLRQLWESEHQDSGCVNAVAWSRDGAVFASRSANSKEGGSVRLWHFGSRRVIHSLTQLPAQEDSWWVTRGLAISPDGRFLATYAPDTLKTIQVWDVSALGLGPKPWHRQSFSPIER